MAISLRAAGTATAATVAVTAVNPAVPTGTTAADLSVLTVWMKPFGTTITTPSGWTKIGEATNGTTAAGTDTGSTKVAVFVRVGAPVGAIGNITFGGSPNSCGAVINTYQCSAGNTWDYSAWQTGTDVSNAANYAAIAASGMVLAANDWVLQSTAINGDVGTQSAQAIGNLGALTLGTYAVRQSADTTTGTDSHGEVGDVAITAGSTSNGFPQFTYTNASSGSGTTLFLRLREVVPVTPTATQAAYRVYADGTESGSTALANQGVAPTVDISSGDVAVGLRMLIQETAGGTYPATTDWQLQRSLNGGAWEDVDTTSSMAVRAYESANLTDAGATSTSRLTGGTGTSTTGRISEDGLLQDQTITASGHIEFLFSIALIAQQLASGNALTFRVLRDGVTTGLTYTSTPTINITGTAPAATAPYVGGGSGIGSNTSYTTWSLVLPTWAVKTGDWIVVFGSSSAGSSAPTAEPDDNGQGYTFVGRVRNTSGNTLGMYVKQAVSGDSGSTVSVTYGTAQVQALSAVIVHGSSGLGASLFNPTTDSADAVTTTATLSSLTPQQATGSLILGVIATRRTGTAPTPVITDPTGYSEVQVVYTSNPGSSTNLGLKVVRDTDGTYATPTGAASNTMANSAYVVTAHFEMLAPSGPAVVDYWGAAA